MTTTPPVLTIDGDDLYTPEQLPPGTLTICGETFTFHCPKDTVVLSIGALFSTRGDGDGDDAASTMAQTEEAVRGLLRSCFDEHDSERLYQLLADPDTKVDLSWLIKLIYKIQDLYADMTKEQSEEMGVVTKRPQPQDRLPSTRKAAKKTVARKPAKTTASARAARR